MCKGETDFFLEGFSCVIKPRIHGAGYRGGLMGVLMGRMGVRVKVCLPKNRTMERVSYLAVGVSNYLKCRMGGSSS